MSLRETLRKAASLLVEIPPDEAQVQPPPTGAELNALLAELGSPGPSPAAPPPASKTVEQIVRETEGPNLDEIQAPSSPVSPVIAADGKVDFNPIYQQSGLPSTPFPAEQMLDMLTSLPPELPLDTRRQTVKVTLNAMGRSIGATPETIVADASRKLAALAAYTETLTRQTAECVAAAQRDITTLEAQIAEKRRAIEDAQRKQAEATQMCSAESDRLDDVLEFFSLDVPPSKHARLGESQP
jgi:hypothetical protein